MAKFEPIKTGDFIIKLANTKEEFDQVYKLRYEQLLLYYNTEAVSEDGKFIDEYDEFSDHLICIDLRNNVVSGTYRLSTKDHIKHVGKFICENEYDLEKLLSKNILELGRAVVREEYRDGITIGLLWRGLMAYATLKDIEFMFGTVSFQGIDPTLYKHALGCIYYNHRSREEIRVEAIGPTKRPMNLISEEELDLKLARKQMPALIRGYIHIGATFGEDVFLDIPFNSTDVFVLLEISKINPRVLKRFASKDELDE